MNGRPWCRLRDEGAFYRRLDLQALIREQTNCHRVAPDVTGFTVPLVPTHSAATVSVAIYRKQVHQRSPNNCQLDLFDPDDGHYEYSAVPSTLDFTIRALWHFMCGRGR